MKKLLVLTDFSPNAAHAEAAALRYSAKLGWGIVLYHTLRFIPLIPSDTAGPYVTETTSMLFADARERLSLEADHLKKLAGSVPHYHPDIEIKNGEGTLSDVIEEISGQREIEMVIMGGRSDSALEHLLTGSDTAAVIRKAVKPVLILPTGAEQYIPQYVVFATDFNTADLPAIDFLIDLSETLDFHFDVVHVVQSNEVAADIVPKVTFSKFLAQRGLSCTQIPGKNVHKSLHEYCRAHQANVLAMTHGRHSLISRLFSQSESLTAITDKQSAVLVFPPAFNKSV
ncbi:universal stress protein [Mucilaginibacter gossypii]|uniref:universal stress protein n=1 Tax=Mucilaginibacter gossypii TaxID=551996 RepID=UPI000DCC66F2|nr:MULTISPECIES: universal stress protein [Mucilaginibacter]QTE38855.1 universal stress protein [Mucilaginibacter gossypii]RAV55070.1 hypothetical protein DIU36_17855 [Mucilaginibacter rubeus]